MEDLGPLIDSVLASVPAALQQMCNRDGILAGLENIGVVSTDMLKATLDMDYQEIKFAIGSAAKPAFIAALAAAVQQRALSAHLGEKPLTSPVTSPVGALTGGAAPTPGAPLSLIVSVKSGAKTLVVARMLTVAADTTISNLLVLAVSEMSSSESTALAELPVKVRVNDVSL